jgi:hypothetical protein
VEDETDPQDDEEGWSYWKDVEERRRIEEEGEALEGLRGK